MIPLHVGRHVVFEKRKTADLLQAWPCKRHLSQLLSQCTGVAEIKRIIGDSLVKVVGGADLLAVTQ